jgi:hypothetical protein
VRTSGRRWVRRHLATLDSCYGSALGPWRAELGRILEEAEEAPLAALNEATLGVLTRAFGISTPIVRSSDLGVPGRASERLAAIGRALGADAYLTGAHALEAYLDPTPFVAAGIEVVVQRFSCPGYRQRFPGAGFVPDLSAVDLLANEPDRALEVLMSGGEVHRGPALAADARA